MQPRRGRSGLPGVRRPRSLACGWGRLLRVEAARVNIGPPPTGRLDHYRRRRLAIRTECRVARVGPTTPTRARRLFDASVDPTDAPYMPIDDRVVENAPRPVAMGRTSSLHLGSDRAGRTAAVLYLDSLTDTCKRHDIEPFAQLQDVLRRLPAWAPAIASALPMTYCVRRHAPDPSGRPPTAFGAPAPFRPGPPLSDPVDPLLRRGV